VNGVVVTVEVTDVVGVVIGVVDAVVIGVVLAVLVAVVVCVVSLQSLKVPSWKESIAAFINAVALHELLMSFMRPEPEQPNTSTLSLAATLPRVISDTTVFNLETTSGHVPSAAWSTKLPSLT
jgi:uncharacterized membrane protein YagU involved in acid resistance